MRAVVIKCETSGAHRYASRIRADARALLKLLSVGNCELSLVLTSDAAIQELNRTFRDKNRPTDVLSFPQMEYCPAAADEQSRCSDGIVAGILGDIVISIDTALRQANRLDLAPESRLRTLVIHGLLHLLGYDHELSRAHARRMFARERELAAALEAIEAGYRRSSSTAAILPITEHP